MRSVLLLVALLVAHESAEAQRSFEIADAPGGFRIAVTVAGCERDTCSGAAEFSLFKRGIGKPLQVIRIPETEFELPYGSPADSRVLAYSGQYIVGFQDVNFDGAKDLSITNGRNGSYGSRSFNIYLANPAQNKFVYDKRFSELTEHMGMFTVNSRSRTIEVSDKSGCCFHRNMRYDVVNRRPRMIYERVEDAFNDPERVKTTTRRLVRGKWKTSVKVERQKG